MSIRINAINKHFGNFHTLKDISFAINTGEFATLLGPSGCGKTTLLRIIAGLEIADSGTILFDTKDVTNTPVQKRGIGFVFQNYALFRHQTVGQNIAFGLRIANESKSTIDARVNELLSIIQLEHIKDRYPHELSGGQRQRVALARAIATKPKLLLLDEPFGALDAKVRKELRTSLRDLQKEVGITTIMVTHDQEEAVAVSDTIIVMNHGIIEQIGSSDELFARPNSEFVVDFLGL